MGQAHRKTRRNYLIGHLNGAEKDLDEARAAGSWQAVSHLRRQALQIRAELDEIEAAEEAAPPPEKAMTEDELVARMAKALRVLPLRHLDPLAEVIRARLGPHAFEVIQGGR